MFGTKGLIHVYTGKGKGKTTAAFGLAVRACGHGAKIAIVQFMKGSCVYGELEGVKHLPGLTLIHTGRDVCIFRGEESEEDYAEAARGIGLAEEFITSGDYDLVVLDEINVASDMGLVDSNKVVDILRRKSPRTEVVLTGRNAPQDYIEMADYVTEMREIKHPFRKGLDGRVGTEY